MIKFITSANNLNSYPDSEKEVVFVGRSNVGKSSLINALYGEVAYVGKTPGKTKLLNFFNYDDIYTICDVPGYGYAKLSDRQIIEFGEMMEEYFTNRKVIKLCVVILDIRRVPNDDDLDMIEYLNYNHIDSLYVLNKADKLSNNQITNQVKLIGEKLNTDTKEFVICSCLNGKNIDNLKDLIKKKVYGI